MSFVAQIIAETSSQTIGYALSTLLTGFVGGRLVTKVSSKKLEYKEENNDNMIIDANSTLTIKEDKKMDVQKFNFLPKDPFESDVRQYDEVIQNAYCYISNLLGRGATDIPLRASWINWKKSMTGLRTNFLLEKKVSKRTSRSVSQCDSILLRFDYSRANRVDVDRLLYDFNYAYHEDSETNPKVGRPVKSYVRYIVELPVEFSQHDLNNIKDLIEFVK